MGAAFGDYDSYLVLSHFKGHGMAGFGGAIKNISIGLGSSEGKNWIHTGGTSRTSFMGGEQDAFLEAMGDAGKSVSDYLGNGERITYINVMNRISIDCDCSGNPAEPDIHDIGILASNDPVALDQACIDPVSYTHLYQGLVYSYIKCQLLAFVKDNRVIAVSVDDAVGNLHDFSITELFVPEHPLFNDKFFQFVSMKELKEEFPDFQYRGTHEGTNATTTYYYTPGMEYATLGGDVYKRQG